MGTWYFGVVHSGLIRVDHDDFLVLSSIGLFPANFLLNLGRLPGRNHVGLAGAIAEQVLVLLRGVSGSGVLAVHGDFVHVLRTCVLI